VSCNWRTLLVALSVLSAYLIWCLSFRFLPLMVAAPFGALIVAWYGSLQHETIHGHPTSSRRLNRAIGALPLSLWVPYAIYRETHIQHHRHSGRRLTEIGRDPESFYLPPGHLASVGRLHRLVLQANCTLLGRLLLGPLLSIATFWGDEYRRGRHDRRRRQIWSAHALALALLLIWLRGVCHIPVCSYLFLVVYPSIAITHLRSFAEHQADDQSLLRTNVVEAHPLLALLFLNNNLHVAHHAYPHVPWHELPGIWQQMKQQGVRCGRIFNGYAEVAQDYLWRPFITAEHPFTKHQDAAG
jgi:fatty acid desaturase